MGKRGGALVDIRARNDAATFAVGYTVDKHGQLFDFMLSDRRNSRAAYRFLRKSLKTVSDYPPSLISRP